MAEEASSDCFTFRSTRFEDTLSNGLRNLLDDRELLDVTFVCDGGISVKAHKTILAACSPYFRRIFAENPCKHPIVVMPDVKVKHFEAIFEFIYLGMVNVRQSETMEFLDTAEALKIKGLTLMLPDKDPDAVVMMAEDASNDCFTFRSTRFEDTLSYGLRNLLDEKDLLDVTFVCEGGDSVKAHKTILAACSPYLRKIFAESPCKHPIVVMPDVKVSHFEAIIDFIYIGLVDVRHSETMEFLDTAEALKIKGLTLMLPDKDSDAVVMENLLIPDLAGEVVMEGTTEEVINTEEVVTTEPINSDDEMPRLEPNMLKLEPQDIDMDQSDSIIIPISESFHENDMSSSEEEEDSCDDSKENIVLTKLTPCPENDNVRRSHRKRIRSKRLPSPDMQLPGLPPPIKIKEEPNTSPTVDSIYQNMLIPHAVGSLTPFKPPDFESKYDPAHSDNNSNQSVRNKASSRVECTICSKTYLNRSHLLRHHRNSHPNVPFPPKEPGQAKMINTSDGQYGCPKCGKRFHRLRLLKQHMSVAHRKHQRLREPGSQKKFQCTSCDKSFDQQKTLKAHYKAAHLKYGATAKENKKRVKTEDEDEEEVTNYKCPECPKTFARRNYISQHIKHSHSAIYYELDNMVKAGKQGYKCPVCSRLFTTLKCLRSHYTLKHRPYNPETIHGKAADIRSASEHKYKCPSCKKIFPSQHSAEKHFKVVHQMKGSQDKRDGDDESSSSSEEERETVMPYRKNKRRDYPYKCEDCERRFLLKVHLINHVRAKHEEDNGEREYKCNKCKKSYNLPHHLLRHVNNIHGKYAHKMTCRFCKRVCTNLNSLRSHVFIHHPGQRVRRSEYE